MALQTSGAISISQIKTELGSTSNSLRALSAAAGKSTPDAMSEFYGYASYVPPLVIYAGSDQGSGAYVVGSGYQNDQYYVEDYNPGPYLGQVTFWLTETGNPIAISGSYYRITMTYLNFYNSDTWADYNESGDIIGWPYDGNGNINSNYSTSFSPYSIPASNIYPNPSRGFWLIHQNFNYNPYTVGFQFWIGPQ
jgi:hypothetical protein